MSRAQQTDNSIKDLSFLKDCEGVGAWLCPASASGHFSKSFSTINRCWLSKKFFDILLALSHPGNQASEKLVGQRFVWFGMRSDIRTFVQTCIKCQRAKIIRHNRAPVQSFMDPNKRFSHIHVDIVCP